MDSLTYTGSGGALSFDLVKLIRLGEGDPLRSRAWSRTLGYRSLSNLSRPAKEVTMQVSATPEAADEARRVFEADMAANSPGVIDLNGWTQRALVPESSNEVLRPSRVQLTLTVALLDGVWRREHLTHFMPLDLPLDTGEGKGYPHGYPYAYGVVSTPKSLTQPGYLPAPCKLVIFGPVSSPSVTIGGNVYAYEGDVPSGTYLTIDGVAKTAVLTSQQGSSTNAMPGLVLGTGEGSGEYAFEPVRPGIQPLSWNGAFGFDAYLYEEEGEVPCCS